MTGTTPDKADAEAAPPAGEADTPKQAHDETGSCARCCHAWNTLVDQPWRIMSLGLRQWAHRS